jgi:hypothetical protein
MKQKDSLMNTVKNQEISDLAVNMVQELKKEFVDEDIALKLASILYSENDIAGSDRIGKNISEITRLIDYHKRQKNSKHNGRRNRRSNRGFSNSRNKSRNRRSNNHRGGR